MSDGPPFSPRAAEPFGAFAPTLAQRRLISLAHRSPLKRGSFRPFVSRLLAALRPGPIDGHFCDLPFRMHHRTNGAERGILLNPGYNAEELDFLKRATPAGGTFVDAGASVGPYSLVLARHIGPAGRVLAIEPHPAALERLAFNIEAAKLANITVAPNALSDREGELMIEAARENLFAGRVGVADGIRVRVRPLAAVLSDAGIECPDSLKIDIEGYEDRALMPYFRAVAPDAWPRAVAIEHLSRPDWQHDCIADMTGRGYAVAATTRSNTLLQRAG